MKNLFAVIAVLLFIFWAVAFIVFHAGPIIHFVLIPMLSSILIRSVLIKRTVAINSAKDII
jgi:hypothetical protein